MAQNYAQCKAAARACILLSLFATLPGAGCDDSTTQGAEGETTESAGPVPFDSPSCHAGADPTLEIGDGSGAFASATEVDLVYGPQGGHHIVLGLKLTDFEPTPPVEVRLEGHVDGQLLGSCSLALGLQCSEDDDALIGAGLLLVWDAPPGDIGNRDVEVLARVTNGTGQTIETTTTLYINDDGPRDSDG